MRTLVIELEKLLNFENIEQALDYLWDMYMEGGSLLITYKGNKYAWLYDFKEVEVFEEMLIDIYKEKQINHT
jgi:ribosomal protein RSM22 (predicted rRNA methylase)